MPDDKSGPSEGIKGVVEDVKGKAKEAVGAVSGNDSLTREAAPSRTRPKASEKSRRKRQKPRRLAQKRPRTKRDRSPSNSPDALVTLGLGLIPAGG